MQKRRTLAQLLAALVVVPLLALLPAAPARADAIPPTNYAPVTIGSDLPGASDVMTDAAGGVTVGCQQSGTSTLFQSFDGNGAKVQDQSNASGNSGSFCPGDTGNSTVGKDGTVYLGVSSGSSQYIQAWKNNSMVWQYTLPCGSGGSPWSMAMGADGNLYVVVAWGGGSCYSWQLIGLSPTAQPGTTTPTVVMNHPVYAGTVRPQGLAAYNDGMVMYTSGGIQYAPYSGDWPEPVNPGSTLPTQVGLSDRWFEATPSGRVFLIGKASAGQVLTCTDQNNRAGSIIAVDPDGTTTSTSVGGNGACVTIHEIHPMPSGGFAMRYAYSDSTTSYTDEERVGSGTWHKQVAAPTQWSSAAMSVDLNGNIAVRQNVAVLQTVDGSSYRFPEVSFLLLDGFSGAVLKQLALRGEHDTTNGPSYLWGGSELAIAKNTVYIAAYQCARWGAGCDMGTTKLYAFTVPGLAMDYPRGAILQHGEPMKQYVALGDSFSSGEGVEPFIAGTDTTGPNRNICHRSEGAYAKLLDGSLGVRLNLTGFRACSGAQTAQITGTWPEDPNDDDEPNLGELAQDEALSSDADVVTISIGGNDVGFSRFVMTCLFLDCSDSNLNQQFFDDIDDLPSALNGAYNDILDEAPNAQVYILGYPQVIPDPSTCANPLGTWLAVFNGLVQDAHNSVGAAEDTLVAIGHWAGMSDTIINAVISAGQVTFTADEMTTARNLTVALDEKIQNTIGTIRPRLRYVDPLTVDSPFSGHELCTDNPYFNGLDVVNQAYSFHPNALGQNAYRQLLLSAM